jgi:hypothetical protein
MRPVTGPGIAKLILAPGYRRWSLAISSGDVPTGTETNISSGYLPLNVSMAGMANTVGFPTMEMSGEAESGSAGTQHDEE